MSSATPVALSVSAALFVGTAAIVLVGHPVGGTARLHSMADYLFSAMLMLIALSVLAAGWALHKGQAGRNGRSGRVEVAIWSRNAPFSKCAFFVQISLLGP